MFSGRYILRGKVMDKNRRKLLTAMSIMSVSVPFMTKVHAKTNTVEIEDKKLSAEELAKHEKYMREAIKESLKNPQYPFGAVIVHRETGEILTRAVNAGFENPILHGEIQAINHYVAEHGNKGWENVALYTTGEPCAMCMGAMAWTGIREVIWATSISGIRNSGISQIDISAKEIAKRSVSFYKPIALIGGVLADEMDKIFEQRKNTANGANVPA